jgi:integrase
VPRSPRPWYRSRDDAWYVQVNRRQVLLARGKASKAEAEAAFYRLMATEGRSAPPSKVTTARACGLFLDHAERSLRPATYQWYRWYLRAFVRRAGDVPAAELKPLHLTAWLASQSGWNDGTRRGAIVAVSRALSWCAAEGHIEANPLRGARKPAPRRRAVPEPEDVARLVGLIDEPPFADLARGLLLTGCRPGELAGATAADFDGATLRVRGKSGARVVHLSPGARALLGTLADRHPDGPLFRNRRGAAWTRNAMRCGFRRWKARTGIGCTAYALRHTFGTLAVERGVDSLLVAELMGHRDQKMLARYYYRARAGALADAAARATGSVVPRPPHPAPPPADPAAPPPGSGPGTPPRPPGPPAPDGRSDSGAPRPRRSGRKPSTG